MGEVGRGGLRNKRRNNRHGCYVLSWKDKSLLIWVVGKKLHYWQEDRICGRGDISHIGPVHSITVGGCFSWAVYNNTCALYFPQINGNVKGATQDGCHRQVNLSTAEQRHAGQGEAEGGPFRGDELDGFLLEQSQSRSSDVSLYLLWADCVLRICFFFFFFCKK